MPSLTASLDISIAESVTKTVDASVVVAGTKSMAADMGMRIVDANMRLVGLDAHIVEPWPHAADMSDRNRLLIHFQSEGDFVTGIALGDPISRELHRTEDGIVRCIGSSCELTGRRALTALSICVLPSNDVRVLVCDEFLTARLGELAQANEGTLDKAILRITRGKSSVLHETEYTATADFGVYFDDLFWDMIDGLDLVDLSTISDDDLVGPLF